MCTCTAGLCLLSGSDKATGLPSTIYAGKLEALMQQSYPCAVNAWVLEAGVDCAAVAANAKTQKQAMTPGALPAGVLVLRQHHLFD